LLKGSKRTRKVNCVLTKNMKENHEFWVKRITEEQEALAASESNENLQVS